MSVRSPAKSTDLFDATSGTLGRDAFSGDAIFAGELERVFARSWAFVGHTSQLPKSGDYFRSRYGPEPVIVVRDGDGQIQVLLNNCRHRGMPVCRYDAGNAASFTCSYHGWSYGLDGSLIGVPLLGERYGNTLDRGAWGLIRARVGILYGSIWATFDEAAPSLEAYLGDMQLYLRDMLQGPDGEDDGYEAIGAILKWQVPCNWKLGAENFAGDHYHGYSHRSVERLAIGLSGKGSRHARSAVRAARRFFNVADPDRGHTVRASVYEKLEPYESQWGEIPEVDAYFRTCHERRQARLGDKARLLVHGGIVFPNTHFNGAGRTTFGVWIPVSPSKTEVWRWLFVPKSAPPSVKEALRQYYLRYAGPAGMVEQDDMENWAAAQRGTQGAVARRYPFNYQLAMGPAYENGDAALPAEWLGTGVSIVEGVAEHNQRAFYAHWAELMNAAPR
jgi:phenylpropionate dioxygenase-like ring-hydroxylating dioxygenase large terminal subunit